MKASSGRVTFDSVADFMAEFGSTKKFVAAKLRISKYMLNGLLLEDGYEPPEEIFDVRSDLADRVAELIGRDAGYVRDFYKRIAA